MLSWRGCGAGAVPEMMESLMALPAGTVTLLFSDIEGSTRLLEHLGEGYAEVLGEHRRIVRDGVAAHGGHELRTEGDAFFVAFARAGDAVRAAVAAQRGLAVWERSGAVAVRVRMGLHTGEPRVVGGDYVGLDVHCAARICSAAHGGQIVVSETTERLLAGEAIAGVGTRDLGEHRLKDVSRPMRLYQLVADGLALEFPALRTAERPPASALGASVPQTTLFGRDVDVDALARLLCEGGNRLVTLVGPGGVGKTRLAIEAAGRVAGEFADGARFVALAAVSEPRELASAITRALAAPVREGESAETALLRFLSGRQLLLVLDNVEQLLVGAPLVGDLIGACPGQRVLVTSREPMRLAAERLYPVRPLAVPDASVRMASSELERYGAVALFLDRVRARDPAFRLDDSNAPAVAAICRRLDGLPLALELAAARCGLLSADELAERLNRALAVLVGGTRDAPQRQRTLRATIDWSYNLLSAGERAAFARMAVFAGGATVAAAEAITGASLDSLDSLVAKQLLERRDGRLVMLETVREYALERLAEDPDRDAIQQRLAAWCLRLLGEATPHLVRAGRASWLARLDAELPNALAALSWALEHRDAEIALQLVGELVDYWWHTRRADDAVGWVDDAVELARDASPRLRAGALLNRARVANLRRLDMRPHADLQESLALYRACDDARGMAACLNELAAAATWVGNFADATTLSQQAIRFAERAHDETTIATALAQAVTSGADYEDVAERARRALLHLRRVGNLDQQARVCVNAGYAAIVERRYRDALAWLDDGLDPARRLDDAAWQFTLLGNLGLATLFIDEFDDARRQFSAALAICRQAGCEDIVDETLLGLAAVEASCGRFPRAARLTGAAKRHEVPRGVAEDAVWSRLTEEILAPAREHDGHERWDSAEGEGAGLTVRDALDLALRRGRFAPATDATMTAARS